MRRALPCGLRLIKSTSTTEDSGTLCNPSYRAIFSPPALRHERSESGGGARHYVEKTIKTREDPDPPPNSSYFLCHASFFSFRFVSFRFVFFCPSRLRHTSVTSIPRIQNRFWAGQRAPWVCTGETAPSAYPCERVRVSSN